MSQSSTQTSQEFADDHHGGIQQEEQEQSGGKNAEFGGSGTIAPEPWSIADLTIRLSVGGIR
jgi:hypothetical protein